MNPSNQHFLFLLLTTFIVQSQVLNPISNCLGKCLNCASGDLSVCKGDLSCEWGFYINTPNGNCTLSPSRQLIWAQLGERTSKNTPQLSESWGDSTKHITCEYNSPSGKKYIDALGLFGGVTMLEKTFTVNTHSKMFELSFNLLRDEWIPFNDFLLIDISSKDETLQSIQISYEQRISVETQHTAILCGNKRVLSQKFNVKILNNNDIGNTLTIVFTSFLFSGQWALTNFKLLSACNNFAQYDQNVEACTICDTDSYLVNRYGGDKVCERCPSLCIACKSESSCISCLDGAILNKNGSCTFPSTFKNQQVIANSSNITTCEHLSFYLSNSNKKVKFLEIKNQDNLLFDQIQIHFKLYYNPFEWNSSTTDRLSIKINKIEVFTITHKNLTNKGTNTCKAFKSNYTAVIQIITPKKIQNDNTIDLEVEYIGKSKDIQFGMSDVYVKSIKKESPKEIQKPIAQNQIFVPEVNNPGNVSLISNDSKQLPTNSISQNIPKPINEVNGTLSQNRTQNITLFQQQTQTDDNISNSINNTSHLIEAKNTTVDFIKEKLKNSANPQIANNDSSGKAEKIPDVKQIMPNETKTVPEQAKINENSDIDQVKKVERLPLAIKTPIIQPLSAQAPKNIQLVISKLIPQPPSKPLIEPVQNQAKPSASESSNESNNTTPIQKGYVQLSTQVAYIPTSNSNHSGLHVVISKVPSLANCDLKVDIDKLDQGKYSITETYVQQSDLHLFIAIQQSFINGKMTVYKIAKSRQMQANANSQISVLAVVDIDRYDSLSSSQLFSINAFSVVFQIFAWVGLISIIIAILGGYGIVVQEYIMSLQLLFLHIYIAADYLPLTFRDVIGGLSSIENLNFLIPSHSEQIQKSWLGNVIQNGPIRFFLYNTGINFTRQFYPIIIINIVYALWFIGLYLSKRFLLRKDLIDQQKPPYYILIDNILQRPINYLDQIWRYQFLATMWCCFIQFYNLAYPEGSNRNQTLNAVLCIAAFICSLGWPAFLIYYCHKYYYENQYSDFRYRFEDVYFLKVHQFYLPSNQHLFGFPIVRSAKLFLVAIIIAYFGDIASLTLLLLIGIQLFEVGYAKHYQIFNDAKYFAHRLIENALFALVELILFFLCTFSSFALTESYVYIGFILSGMSLLIVVNSFARAAHLAYKKYMQMFHEDFQLDHIEKPKTQRVV